MKEYYLVNKDNNHKYVALQWNKNTDKKNIFHYLFPAVSEQLSPQDELKQEVITMRNNDFKRPIDEAKRAFNDKMHKDLPKLLKKHKDHQKMSRAERHFLHHYFDVAWKLKVKKMNEVVEENNHKDYLKRKQIAYRKLNNHQKLTNKEHNLIRDDRRSKAMNKVISIRCNSLKHRIKDHQYHLHMKRLQSKHANSITRYKEVHGYLFLISDEGTQVVKPDDYIFYDEKFLKNYINPDKYKNSRYCYPVLYVCNKQNINKHFKEIKNTKLPSRVWLIKEHKYNSADYKNVAVANSKLNAQCIAYKLSQKSFENDYIYQEHKLDWNKMMNISK